MAGNLTAMIAAAFSGGAAPPVTSDPYFDYTTLLLPGTGTNGAQNNTFLDSSSNTFTVTRNGNTTQGTFSPFSQTGWGNYFDGTGDYLSVANATALQLSTGVSWCLEAFVFPVSLTSDRGIIAKRQGTTYEYQFSSNASGLNFWNGSTTYTAGQSLTVNQWQHVACTWDGTTLRFFINGTIAPNTYTSTFSMIASSTATVNVGANHSGGEYWNGYISNARIVKGSAVYTSNFTPSTTPLTAITNTSLLTCQSNRFIDNSSNNFTITRNGDTSVVAFSPFNPSAAYSTATNGGSGYFDGNGDFLTAANNTAFDLSGSISWCIELWAYWNNTSGEQNILEKFATTPAGWTLYKQTTGAIELYNGSTTTSFSTVVANQWYHIVLCRDNTTNTFSFYLNGTRTSTSSLSIASNAATSLVVGARTSNSNYFNGYMSGVRIVKGSSVYDPTQTSITVPTAPPTNITNTSLLLNFTNAGVYDATSKNDLETVGNAQISSTTAKWGSTSIYFDGNGDYLYSPSNDLYNISSGDFTIECWVYRSSTQVSTYPRILTIGNANYSALVFWTSGTTITVDVSTTGSTWTNWTFGGATISNDTWTHLALVRNSGSISLYKNGTSQGTAVSNTSFLLASPVLYVGTLFSPAGNYWTGYIQDLRITKGYARYTANFTAPTAAFPLL